MTNVDIQNLWERHAARRTYPHLARTRVCRNLFGPVDHEELGCEMQRRLQEISEQDQTRWNFNFEDNVPLPGNYEWEEISVSAVPSFYKESVRNGKARNGNAKDAAESNMETGCKNEAQSSFQAPTSSVEVNQENRSGALNAQELVTPVCRRRSGNPEPSRQNTTHITDFFPKRKRSLDTKQTERSSSSIPAEVTPRKRIRW
ncbi:cyclin-dependent kinase inhibitor 1C [Silurus asotus]|uniref:Cyclin-dependent kinase inhibitor 1C n=1 Tax=Silurus asotus TaxID=30991 RepID=A0AAD5B2F2_SILAS|nr:cyclin-dependent kinase inhibitor 1C [Silurus asotus]